MDLLTDTESLAEFCKRVSKEKFVTVDTEFIRDKTYWPRLCVVQVGGADEAQGIDAMAPGIDLKPLFDLMAKKSVLKVFHAARQDVEIFLKLSGKVPVPLFDTQVAAMVCGFGDSVGYEKLVSKLARQRIDKTMRYTDWSRRPLDKRQIEYAMADVTHLRVVYEKLSERLEKDGRSDWVSEEMAALAKPDTYRVDPDRAWRRIKTRIRKRRHLGILKELAAWREAEAQSRDVPRNRVLRDEALTEIAAHEPTTVDDLLALRGMRRESINKTTAAAVAGVVKRACAMPEDSFPEPPSPPEERAALGPAMELLKVLLKMKCETHDVAQKLVASSDELEALARDDDADVPALQGWRRELFGADALKLKRGEIALTASGSRLKLIELGARAPAAAKAATKPRAAKAG